ncbi:MAG: PDZ domain-containing protein [Acidobacteriota bacterium]|nr:PDZ domain-containing protein [Acidobacteriota bacterium]
MHPSELPSFDSLAATRKRLRSRIAGALATVTVVALLAGGAGLASTRGVNPTNASMASRQAVAWSKLPAVARTAAARTVDLTITEPGHVNTVAAMVLSNNLAVTTTPIPRDALLTASTSTLRHVPVTWVGRDTTMGFSIVRLGVRVPALTFGPLPASAAVTAVAPIVTSATAPLRFISATTTLGDPQLAANGVVSYLATRPHWNLNGLTDAVAVDDKGTVVAVLSANHLWYSAQFVARVASIVATGNGCHSSLGIRGTTAQGGGVLVTAVAPRGSATGHLRTGDVVLRVAGHDTDSWDALLTALYLTPAGTMAHVTFLRGAATKHAEVILACAL